MRFGAVLALYCFCLLGNFQYHSTWCFYSTHTQNKIWMCSHTGIILHNDWLNIRTSIAACLFHGIFVLSFLGGLFHTC
jgi:hypothetical protein